MAQVKKISVAKVCGKINGVKLFTGKKEGESVAVMDVIGIATGMKNGVSDYGEWSALQGRFKAKNLLDEKAVYVEGVQCFLPDVALIPIIQALDNGAMSAEFAVRIIAVPAPDTQIGFEYQAEPLIAPEPEADPLEKLLKAASKKIAALAAPTESKK